MQLLNISAIAVALAMDAFAVAIAAGVTLKKISFRQNFRLAWHFGLFQAMMPVLGWSAGLSIRGWIADYDHWVAFGLLAFVAQGMLRAAFKKKTGTEERKDPTRGLTMVMLSVATSIDALAVGFTLSLLVSSLAFAVIMIGVITFALSYAGVSIGKRFGHFFESKIEILGGLILIAIGVKIFVTHLINGI